MVQTQRGGGGGGLSDRLMSRKATGITETDVSAMNINSRRQIDRKTDNTTQLTLSTVPKCHKRFLKIKAIFYSLFKI